jgi:hypothetical protein
MKKKKQPTFWKPQKRLRKQKKIVRPIHSYSIFKLKPTYKRTTVEKRLIKTNPWGDRDGDGVPNWIDCKPFDRKKQGKSKLLIESISKELWGRKPSKKVKINSNIESETRYLAKLHNADNNIVKRYSEYELAKDIAKRPEHIAKIREVKIMPGPDTVSSEELGVGGQMVSKYAINMIKHAPINSNYYENINSLAFYNEGKNVIGVSKIQVPKILSPKDIILHELGHSKHFNEDPQNFDLIIDKRFKEEKADKYAKEWLQESKDLRTDVEPVTEVLQSYDSNDLEEKKEVNDND